MPFFYLCPIKGLSSPPMGFRPAFAWDVVLGPGLVWRTVREADLELFDQFWDFFTEGISAWARKRLRDADTWLVGEADDEAAIQAVPGQVVSFAVAASLQGRTAIQTRFMIFEGKDGLLSPWHSRAEDWVRVTRPRGWSSSVQVDQENLERRERIAASFGYVRRAFGSADSHAFLRAVGRYRGAIFSQFVEATAILLCASLEALSKFEFRRVQKQIRRRLLPRYSKKTGNEEEVLAELYKLRDASAHGLIHELDTKTRRGEALSQGYDLTRQILRSALADNKLYEEATKGPDEMKAYLDRDA
jgi:hypothetical protein